LHILSEKDDPDLLSNNRVFLILYMEHSLVFAENKPSFAASDSKPFSIGFTI